VALKRRYRWPLGVLLDLTFRAGFAAGGIGIVILFIGGQSDVLLASLMIVGGTATVVGSYSLSDRITLPRWVVDHRADTVRLWRPTGPEELALVKASGWRAWPPRLPDQPIFYPVLSREYAATIARDWNVPHSGVGYVTTFEVKQSFLNRYQLQQVGGREILEYWIPADDLADLNKNIVGRIEVVAEYRET
jgi:hypothetical protein